MNSHGFTSAERQMYTPQYHSQSCPCRRKRGSRWDGTAWAMFILAMVFLIALGCILAPKANAVEEPRWEDVKTTYGACVFAKEHPGSITNSGEVTKNCV